MALEREWGPSTAQWSRACSLPEFTVATGLDKRGQKQHY